MSRLALYLLGPPRIELDGEAVHIGRKKALALLAYLAVMPGKRRRDTLATLLWPDYDQSSSRTHLRRALVSLTNRLGSEWFVTDRESIGLDPTLGLWLDVAQFHQRLAACETHAHTKGDACPDCLALLTEAAELYRDDFMAGFSLPDSLPFDEWQRHQTKVLRDDLGSVLERLSACHAAQGEYEPAIAAAQRWLELDPLHEAAHRRLMELYAHADRTSAALRQYRACVRVLEQELGVPPSAETTALYERLRTERLVLEETPAPSPTPADRAIALPAFLRQAQNSDLDDAAASVRVEGPVFVARETELAWLDGCLGAALEGQGKVVFITGGPGRGKTALMRAFAQRALATHPDLLVANGNCSAYSGIGDPYLPFREVLAMLTGDVEARWAAGVISRERAVRLWAVLPLMIKALLDHGPHLIEIFVSGTALLDRAQTLRDSESLRVSELQKWVERRRAIADGPGQSRIFQQFADTLCALATEHPLLLTLDDLQWVDSSSASLLFHLGRRLGDAGGRVLILGAYRAEEVAVDRNGERHPLRKLLSEYRRSFGEVWLDLAAADEVQGRVFVDAYLDSEPNQLGEEFRSALSDRTAGHPLFTIELLRGMQARGELVQDAQGVWIAGPALDWETLPVRVEAAIQERIERLDEEKRDLLAVASVEGEVFTAQAAARVQGLSEREVLHTLSRELGPLGHRLVREAGEVGLDGRFLSRYQFGHALFQAYLYDRLGAGERRLLHSELAAALEGLYGDHTDPIAPALAYHYQAAGRRAKAAAFSLRAGELAYDASAHFEAIRHSRSAVGLYRELRDQSGEAKALRLLYGLHFELDVKTDEVEEYRREALRLYRELEDRDGEAGMIRVSGFRFLYRTDVARAESSFQEALAISRESGDLRGQVWALQGLSRLYHECTCNFRRSRACAEEAMQLSRELDDSFAEAAAGFELGVALHYEGDYAGADPYLKQGVQVYRERSQLIYVAGCLIHVGLNAIALGDYAAALAHLEQSSSTYQKFGMEDRNNDAASAQAALALLFHRLGENQTAQNCARRAISICRESGYRTCLATALTHLGHALVGLGELDDAVAVYQEALDLRRDVALPDRATEPLAGLARVSLARDDPAEALAYVEQILSHLETGSVDGTDEPLRIYLTCYRVLKANDARAEAVLEEAHNLLQERAAKITDEELRRSFLENVAAHRELVSEWQAVRRHELTRT